MVDDAFDGVVVTDRDGRVIYANAAYLDLIDAADANDMRPVERVFIGDADASEAIYRLLKAAREGKRLQEEVRVAGNKGRPARWLRLRVRPLGDGARARRLTVWSLSDVTRERERQENVFQELQHAIDYLDHAPAGFFSVDAKGDVVYLNATLANWLDQDLAQVGSGGLKLADLVAGDGAALLTTLRAAPGEVKTEVLDLDLKTRSGRTLPVRLFHKLAFGADGSPGASRTLVLNRARDDGTDPQRAAEIRFMRFFHHTPMAIATVDRDGGIVRTNPLFARLFHNVLSRREAATARSAPSLPSATGRRSKPPSREAARGKGDIAPVDAALAGESERFGRFYVTAVEEEERDQEAAIVYALETTAQRELETKLNQQQKMELVGQLAGGIAHDFNNVLSAIIMATDFLLNAHKPTDPSFGDIMQIKQNANRAASLVRHLLAFSRKQTLRPQVLDLGEVLSDLTMLLRRLDRREGHARRGARPRSVAGQGRHLAVRAGDREPRGQCARRHARGRPAHAAHHQRHRARNATRFHAKGMPAADYVLVEVADTGTGIPEAILDKIFDPFFSTKEVGKGTGLGLSTVYGIIKQTGGFVYVDSVVHEGTTFRIFLPRHVASAQEAAAERAIETEAPAIAQRARCGRSGQARGERRSHRRRHHPPGRGRGGVARAQRARARLARLYRARSRQRRRGDRRLGEIRQPRRPRRLRRGHAGNGRPDLGAGIAQPQSGPEDHLRLRLCRGRLPKASARSDGQYGFLPKPFTLKQLVAAVKETLAA